MPDAIDTTPLSPTERALSARIDAVLPQTQCTKCGYAGCTPYAEAIATGRAGINQCPPGGAAGIARLARLTARPAVALNPANGVEGPLRVARIDEALCIGCTLCIQACPVDAIVGAAKRMHTVLAARCTGCDLCVAPCPMDCIAMLPGEPPRPWSDDDALAARARFEARKRRLVREQADVEARRLEKAVAKLQELERSDPAQTAQLGERKARVAAAIERARQRRLQSSVPPQAAGSTNAR
jgi:H+/Na+-translocating ferredoxin:NAD+ oxidoreductase subunit B